MIVRRRFNSFEDALGAGFKIEMGNGEYGREVNSEADVLADLNEKILDSARRPAKTPPIHVTLDELRNIVRERLTMKIPTPTPSAHSIRKAAKDGADRGSLFIERPQSDSVIVTVRSPGMLTESRIVVPYSEWLKLRDV